ncbi:dihydroorotate dehydrogenase [Lasius niger]|uniref:Dihydroorotate dehydrogenase (quinone), mitochondrial n=1 Tax=Lasius niger TaxID=67767 RepID=A0A0J7L0S6_LASNI|nr:dihydroorotate dehydrogenase [Lasius niger]
MGQKFWKYLPRKKDNPRLNVNVMGIPFANPIGMAAGFDKNAKGIHGLNCLGFGFVEAGTVTPRQQPGNPRPRLFRLDKDRAVINRMGFNSPGEIVFEKNLKKALPSQKRQAAFPELPFGFPLGINIGINKLDAEPLTDYPALVERFSPYASYIAINLSSPNTPGLRDLQNVDFLEKLLTEVNHVNHKKLPIFIKLAPDLEDEAFSPLLELCIKLGATGLILTNTTKSRAFDLQSKHLNEEGGLSGAPLQKRSLEVLKLVARLNKGRLILISSGGIETGAEILNRLKHGADLVQIYSAFIYEGTPLLAKLKRELLSAMDQAKIENLSDIRTLFPLDKS